MTFIIGAEKKVCCLVSTYFQIIQVYIPHSVFTCDTEYVQRVGTYADGEFCNICHPDLQPNHPASLR
jgi:hypothetical protein